MAGWGVSLNGFGGVLTTLQSIQTRFGTDAVYVTGPTAEYAVDLETGRANHPPYPFAGPAVEDYKRDPAAFMARNTELDLGAIGGGDELVKTVALAMQRQMMVNVNAGGSSEGPSGRRSPGTDSNHPKIVTGNLVNSFRVVRVR